LQRGELRRLDETAELVGAGPAISTKREL
jgi:hypothetical protein